MSDFRVDFFRLIWVEGHERVVGTHGTIPDFDDVYGPGAALCVKDEVRIRSYLLMLWVLLIQKRRISQGYWCLSRM